MATSTKIPPLLPTEGGYPKVDEDFNLKEQFLNLMEQFHHSVSIISSMFTVMADIEKRLEVLEKKVNAN